MARELHDTLIQGCTTVSALLEASSLTKGAESENLVDHAREQIRSTTEMARRVVWNLRNDEKSHEGFMQTVEMLVDSFRKDFNLPVEFSVSGRPIAMSEGVEHELRMVMREALYNAARHAHASDVRVAICYRSDAVEVMLSDDGIGFDVERVTGKQSDHYGLKGILERIERIGGSVHIESLSGNGTHITIVLPNGSFTASPECTDEPVKG
jgi:signal transduction histidine kinase